MALTFTKLELVRRKFLYNVHWNVDTTASSGLWLLMWRESDNSLTAPLNQGRQRIVKWGSSAVSQNGKANNKRIRYRGPWCICFTPGLPLRIGNYAYFFRDEALMGRTLISRFQWTWNNIQRYLICTAKYAYNTTYFNTIAFIILFYSTVLRHSSRSSLYEETKRTYFLRKKRSEMGFSPNFKNRQIDFFP